VWCLLFRKGLPRRRSGQSSAEIYQRLYVQCLSVKAYLFQKPQANTPEETAQPAISRDLGFFLNVTSTEPHKVTHKELSDLVRDLELS
jgi:hypothetical protein